MRDATVNPVPEVTASALEVGAEGGEVTLTVSSTLAEACLLYTSLKERNCKNCMHLHRDMKSGSPCFCCTGIDDEIPNNWAPRDVYKRQLKRRGLPSAQKKNPEPKKPAA